MIDRTTLLRGPGVVSYASAAFFSDDELTVVLHEDWADRLTSGYGRIGRTLKNRWIEISCKPTMWASLATLFPYATAQPGDVLFTGTPAPLVITPRNGRPLTILDAQITALGGLALAADQATFKSAVKWTGLCSNNADPSFLASYYTEGAAAANVALTGFVAANVFRSRYSASWNSVTLRADQGGYQVDFKLELEADQPDGEPVCNFRVRQLEATCKFTPVGLTESAYLGLLNNGVDLGASPAPASLAIAGVTASGAPAVTLVNAFLEAGAGYHYGPKPRLGALQFTTIRTLTSNLLASLWTMGSS